MAAAVATPLPIGWSSYLRQRAQSFVFAFRGAQTLIRTQHNAWIHVGATVAAVIAGFLLRLSRGEWGLLVVAIALVWIAEALNTAIEFLGDEISEAHRARIGQAKDVAAFSVLIAAAAAVVIGAIVFLPRLGWTI